MKLHPGHRPGVVGLGVPGLAGNLSESGRPKKESGRPKIGVVAMKETAQATAQRLSQQHPLPVGDSPLQRVPLQLHLRNAFLAGLLIERVCYHTSNP